MLFRSDLVFLDESNVSIVSFCSTIQKGQSIDFSSVVYDSNFESKRPCSDISNHIYWYIVSQLVKVPDGTSSTMG